MAYPTKLLNPGEEIALDLTPHWWTFSKHMVTSILLVVLGVVAVRNNVDYIGTGLRALFAIAAVVWAGWLVVSYLSWRFTHFVVTDQRVVFRTGVLSKHGVEIPLERINNINFHQRIFERMIGAGDLDIESAGKDGQSHFDNVRRPDDVQQEIYAQIESNARRQASWRGPETAPASPARETASSVPEQIAQLAALRDQGLITEEEFASKKTELLGRM